MSTREKCEHFNDGPLIDGITSIVAAAHELKSPLVLMRQLSLMLEEGDVSAEDQKRMLRRISLTSERALRLTSDLTKSVRLQDAMFELEPINPHQLCEDVIHELGPLFEANNRKFNFTHTRKQLLLVANRDLLRRIIINFSDNALHYTELNSIVEIKIKSIKSGEKIRLGVRDYGPSPSNDIIKKLKNSLNKSPAPLHSRPLSSGLGLYIASQFAGAMNGEIGITRHRDGATFYVDLQASRQLSLI